MKPVDVICVSDDDVINGLLTYGKTYECIARSNYNDFKIMMDDQNNSRWFKAEFFRYD